MKVIRNYYLKKLAPTRLVTESFPGCCGEELRLRGASADELRDSSWEEGRAKKGIFEGDLEEGELEIGQVVGFCFPSAAIGGGSHEGIGGGYAAGSGELKDW